MARFIDHLLEGDHASRPAAGDVPQGTLYSCSDTGHPIYQSDGVSSWSTWRSSAAIADILDLTTAEMDDTLVFGPDGAGGVQARAEAGGGGGGALAAHPLPLDAYAIDGTHGDDFDAASLDAAWTRRNFTGGAETYQVGPAGTYMKVALNGRAAGDGYFRTAPAGDWTIAMAFSIRGSYAPHWGLMVVDTNGTGVGFAIYHGAPNAPLLQAITTYTSSGGSFYEPWFGATTSPNQPLPMPGEMRKLWFYLRKSGTDYYCAYSLDGETWSDEGGPIAWSGTVDRVAMGLVALAGTSVASTDIIHVDWFNKIA